MDALIAFLTARYDEWERQAREAYPHETGSRDEGQPPSWVTYRRGPGNAEFGLRHVATLRAILAEHAGVDPCDAHDGISLRSVPCDTLRLLAADFSHLPDYRQEWAPDQPSAT